VARGGYGAPGEVQVKLVFEDESWVEIKDATGDIIFSQLNAPGTERVIRGHPPFAVIVGNAHAVRLSYRDRPVDLEPHTRVDVARVVLQ
jgi:cytoskeleton protein RodZ